jgi:purine-binding chemotaxis protein CheW
MKKTTPPSDAAKGRKRRAGDAAAAEEAIAPPLPPRPAAVAAAPAPDTQPADPDEDRDPLAEFFVSQGEREVVTQGFAGDGQASPAARTIVELLAFWVADEEYAIDIVEIQEIIKVPLITELPRAHETVLGIISLRGTIVPVLDLRRVLRLEEKPVGRPARILVVRAGDEPVGLLVDRVTSVVRFESEKIEPTPRTMRRQTTDELVRGVGRVGTRLIIVLDVNSVVNVMDSAA